MDDVEVCESGAIGQLVVTNSLLFVWWRGSVGVEHWLRLRCCSQSERRRLF